MLSNIYKIVMITFFRWERTILILPVLLKMAEIV